MNAKNFLIHLGIAILGMAPFLLVTCGVLALFAGESATSLWIIALGVALQVGLWMLEVVTRHRKKSGVPKT